MSIDGIVYMTVDEFFAIPTGTHVYNNGADQCVALANLYDAGVLQYPLPSNIQSAFQWWTTFSYQPNLYEHFTQVADMPKRGDIFVGRYGPYQAENGHIGVVERDWDGGTFGTMENGYWSDGRSYVNRFNRNMDGILGFLRQNSNNGDEMTPDQAQKLNAIYDALFKKTSITAATTGYKDITGGVLNVLSHMSSDGSSGGTVSVDYDRIIRGVADEISKRMAQ